MTTVVGVQGRDFAVLACDSRVFDEDSGRYLTMTSDTCKIVECDEFLCEEQSKGTTFGKCSYTTSMFSRFPCQHF